MDRDNALNRIRKCLALAGSTNANESATALRQAQALMRAYGIELGEAKAPRIDQFTVAGATRTRQRWEAVLSMTVAAALGIRVYSSARSSGTVYVYYGPDGRVALAEYAHAVLRRALIKARTEFGRTLTRSTKSMDRWEKRAHLRSVRDQSRSFAIGFAKAVHDQVRALAETPEETTALEIYRADLGLRPARSRAMTVSQGALNAGRAAGADYGINRPVAGTERLRIAR